MIFQYIATQYYPNLKYQLRVAHIDATPEEYVRTVFVNSSKWLLLIGALLFFMIEGRGDMRLFFALLPITYLVAVWFGMQQPTIKAYSRAKDIDREIIFAGRYLLVKLHSGTPLVNALFQAANSYGVASDYFKEIVQSIELGTPLEEAIEQAMTYSASDNFRKILFQIHNALKLGMNVTHSLEAILDEIQARQLIEIQEYGKKLGTISLVYLIVGVVFPSLGMTLVIVFMTFMEIQVGFEVYAGVTAGLGFLNYIFITMFKGIRPKLNI